MSVDEEFNHYIAHLSEGLGHADRHAGLSGYCTGLMLPLSRKSVEPMAARVDPLHASARHQALHHFVAKSEWSDSTVMARVRDWVIPGLGLDSGRYWVIDDTGFPKKGKHSVGVARRYCGQLGKQDNCQVAVSLSLASAQGSLSIAYQPYLPKDWANDAVRRETTGVPKDIAFASKPEIALTQIRQAIDQRVSPWGWGWCWQTPVMVMRQPFEMASLRWACSKLWVTLIPFLNHSCRCCLALPCVSTVCVSTPRHE